MQGRECYLLFTLASITYALLGNVCSFAEYSYWLLYQVSKMLLQNKIVLTTASVAKTYVLVYTYYCRQQQVPAWCEHEHEYSVFYNIHMYVKFFVYIYTCLLFPPFVLFYVPSGRIAMKKSTRNILSSLQNSLFPRVFRIFPLLIFCSFLLVETRNREQRCNCVFSCASVSVKHKYIYNSYMINYVIQQQQLCGHRNCIQRYTSIPGILVSQYTSPSLSSQDRKQNQNY